MAGVLGVLRAGCGNVGSVGLFGDGRFTEVRSAAAVSARVSESPSTGTSIRYWQDTDGDGPGGLGGWMEGWVVGMDKWNGTEDGREVGRWMCFMDELDGEKASFIS